MAAGALDLAQEEDMEEIYGLTAEWLQGYQEWVAQEELWCEGKAAFKQICKIQKAPGGAWCASCCVACM